MEERAHRTCARYRQRLKQQLRELTSEHLPAILSEEEHNEILTEVIQDALAQVVEGCQEVAKGSGLSEGQVIGVLIEKEFGGTTHQRTRSPYRKPS